MKRFGAFVGVVVLAAIAGSGAAFAQPPTGQWFYIHQEFAKPSQLALYESTAKEFAALVQANRAAMPTFHADVFQNSDFSYSYIMPVEGFATADKVYAEFGGLMMAAGARMAEISQRGSAALDHYTEFLVGEEPAMGYAAAAPRLAPDKAKFFHYTLYYLLPGTEMEASAIAKDYAALFRSKNIADSYRVYWAVTGPDLPVLAVEQWANDENDFRAAEARNGAALGDAVAPVDARALAITRRIERFGSVYRPDLSIPAPPKK